jgi:hypothetical protein
MSRSIFSCPHTLLGGRKLPRGYLQRLALSEDSGEAVRPIELPGTFCACHWNGRASVIRRQMDSLAGLAPTTP